MVEESVKRRAKLLQRMDNLVPCSGYGEMVVTGIVRHVPLQLKVGICPSFNGREQMDVTGVVIHVTMQLVVGISPSSNGLEQMDVTD